ncbi:pyridoxamine 5'-phosphate oxidase-domain-containing protein [Leucosporidium creatinivorum]|uniref:Pyridoxamine 5'-phosphate oxidase-domain-containing protein n=1 Tax=Leucosporidium creatinivorum TaxID=106004 RepID=A0A1Y2G2Q4_9BASI|nr:pyridoxamine 5'-phosphate oxidase-domain-containing protein [Leucosporidium creatinivorum]
MLRSLLLTGFALVSLASAARETVEESIIHTRELIQYRGLGVGVLMSKYPEGAEDDTAGLPIGLQEYYAPYPESNGDILLLAMPVAKVFRNALPPNPPNMTLTVSDTYGFGDGNLAAGRMRVALFGSLERVTDVEESKKCRKAYLEAHPDATWAAGGPNEPHFAFFARLRIHKVFTFGGFGDKMQIMWHPIENYRAAGKKMRSKKEVLSDWPEPEQPEALTEAHFGESATKAERLVVQL